MLWSRLGVEETKSERDHSGGMPRLSSTPEPFNGLSGVAFRSRPGGISVSQRVPNGAVFGFHGCQAEAFKAGLQDQKMGAEALHVARLCVGILNILQSVVAGLNC